MNTSIVLAVARIPLVEIAPDPDQPRRHFDEEKLQELADSIREHGLIQPITLVPFEPKPTDEFRLLPAQYRVLSGERRYRASMLAGADDIPAIVRRDLNGDQIAVLQAIENFQRADLTLQETASICEVLVAKLGLEQAAEQLGKSKPWVSMRARVNSLPERVLKLIRNGRVKDVQIAHLLAQILEIDPEAQRWSVNNVWAGFESEREDVTTPSRNELQVLVNRLREAVAAESEAQEREAKRRQDNAAGQGSAGAADSEDEDNDNAAGREQRMLQLRSREESPADREQRLIRESRQKRREELEKDAEPVLRGCIDRLAKVLGIELDRDPVTGAIDLDQCHEDLDISVSMPSIYNADVPLPKSVDELQFSLIITLKRPQLERAVAAIEGPATQALSASTEAKGPGHIDAVREFIATCVTPDPEARFGAGEAYTVYSTWAKKKKREPLPVNIFALCLEDAGIEKGRTAALKFYKARFVSKPVKA